MTNRSLTAVSPERRAQIQSLLQDIEQEQDIQILLAVESGSRAWNMHSPDSDYDVRFIYMHKPEWYVSTGQKRDVIDFPVNDDLDLHGWDVRKALGLLSTGNTTLLEWLNSPIRYAFNPEFSRAVRHLLPDQFVRSAYVNHFRGLGWNHYQKHIEGQEFVSAKKLFYVIRPALSLLWLREAQEPLDLPLDIEYLLNAVPLENDLRQRLFHAMEIKRDGLETGKILQDQKIDGWLQDVFQAKDLRQEKVPTDPETKAAIDQFLWATIQQGQEALPANGWKGEIYKPNNLSHHEALHMSWFLMDAFERHICAHGFVEYDLECRAQASKTFKELFRKYQLLGSKSDA